jgi:DNA-binding winged helix-turn-helix (wHTH) protein/Flp pilus assembly protein TadD
MLQRSSKGDLEFGPFRLDPVKRVLWRGGELVALAPKAVDVLLALVEQPGDVVAKGELMRRVWPDAVVEEANLSVHVAQLRKALGRQMDGRPYIATLARRGYRFLAPVRRAGPPSLAVLPFRSLAGESQDDVLGIGMADAVITRLASLETLTLRPTSAVTRYAGAEPVAAGRELRVEFVLDGRMQRDGARIRVTVQLVSVASGSPQWADAFEAETTGLFALQDTIAGRVAEALAMRLGLEERRRLVRRPTADLEAYRAYLRGRYLWSRFTEEAVGRAVGCFHEALDRDPGFALPHAGLADASVVLGFSGLLPPREAWPAAAQAARRALERDEAVAEAHVSLGFVLLFQDWDWAGAARELARAVALAPSAAGPRLWSGLFHVMRGRFEDARREIDVALELDPLSVVVQTLDTFQLRLTRQHARALEQARRAVEQEPHHFLGHWNLGLACLDHGLTDEAVSSHRRAVELADGMALTRAVLARTLAVAGDLAGSRALLAELRHASQLVSAYQCATVEVALGAPDAALASLERAGEERDPWLVWLQVDPMLDPLRREPRFAALLARVVPPTPSS